jgi:hypothetical protein
VYYYIPGGVYMKAVLQYVICVTVVCRANILRY